MLDRTVPPIIKDAVDFDYVLPSIERVKLDNGTMLYWLNSGVQDVVEIDWVFRAGLWWEQKRSVAQATATLLRNGTRNKTAAEIHEALELYGAQLKTSAGSDYSTVTLYSMTRHLPVILPIVLEILLEATFPESELEIHKRNTIQRLLVNLRQGEFVANQQIDALLFGEEHPYGRYTKQAHIEALQSDDLRNFYQLNYTFSDAVMFMGGKVGEREVKLINSLFGSINSSKVTKDDLAFPVTPTQQNVHRIENDANAVQGAIRIGRHFPNRHHLDYTPMVVLNTLFGGYFGSRLMSNIREEKGYTYGIYSSLSPEIHGGTLVIQTETGVSVVEDAIKEVYHEMDILCSEPASDDEVLLVKNYLLGGLLGDLDGPFSILRRWRSLILNGFTEEHFYNNVETYKTITPADLQALAQKYLVKDSFVELAVI